MCFDSLSDAHTSSYRAFRSSGHGKGEVMFDENSASKSDERLAKEADAAYSHYDDLAAATLKLLTEDDQYVARNYLVQLCVRAPQLFNAEVLRNAADDIEFVQQTMREIPKDEQSN